MKSSDNDLKRVLKSRHLNMIALGGTIGTGLFLSSGATVSMAGPGGALLAFILMGVMIYFLMTSMGEMSTALPVSGSIQTFASRFVDPALGFSVGWMFWLSYMLTIASELSAAAILMAYWFPNVNGLIWSAIGMVILLLLNVLSAKAFGEAEFWFAGIKVVVVIIFIVVGVLTIFGILGGSGPIGLKNFTVGDAPFVGNIGSFISVFMVVGFSFMGTELVTVAAGESENPSKNIPKAIKSVFWRILIFYIGTIFVIACVIPYTDPHLLNMDLNTIAVSPFTLVFEKAGMAVAAAFVNAVILTSVLSCGNSGLYSATRMLYALSKDHMAPKVFSKVNKGGVPIAAIIFTTILSSVCFLSSLVGEGNIYLYLISSAGLTGFICWGAIAWSHYRFRKGCKAQGIRLSQFHYTAKLFPFGPIMAMALTILIIIGQSLSYISDKVDVSGLMIAYLGVPVFIIALVWYKVKNKTKIIPYDQMDLSDLNLKDDEDVEHSGECN